MAANPNPDDLKEMQSPLNLRGPENDLAFLQYQFPYLPIMPPPYKAVSFLLPTANVARSVQVPDQASMLLLRGSTDYYVSFVGNAIVPTAANSGELGDPNLWPQVIYAPEGVPWYVGKTREFSVVSPYADCVITASFYLTGSRPSV